MGRKKEERKRKRSSSIEKMTKEEAREKDEEMEEKEDTYHSWKEDYEAKNDDLILRNATTDRREKKKKKKKQQRRELEDSLDENGDEGNGQQQQKQQEPQQEQFGGESTAERPMHTSVRGTTVTSNYDDTVSTRTAVALLSDDEEEEAKSAGSKTKKDKKRKKKEEKKKKRKEKKDSKHELTDSKDSKKKKKDKKTKGSGIDLSAPLEGNDTNNVQETNSIIDDTKDSQHQVTDADGKIVASSAIEFYDEEVKKKKRRKEIEDKDCSDDGRAPQKKRAQEVHTITLLLFYTYVEPVWDEGTYNFMLHTLQEVGDRLNLTGRMRVAKEGLNCTLTGLHENIVEYCTTLRRLRPKDFENTEFKLTYDLPLAQKFPNLKVFKVVELVHYGLEGTKAPPIAKYQGTHLEPKDYHHKLAEKDTVVIDVRNHYEAAIGRFDAPNSQWLDPKMRKSTEFPAWLDKPETMEMMRGKQVMMYCTGGIRCERASALLKFKMETDPEIKDLGIKGVFQLQGGIDKYFKEFPDGGYWKGKNYVFDKRFAHAPPKVDGELHGGAAEETKVVESDDKMGKCEACLKPWDMYRGKRRCPTCGVPSLICRECFLADRDGTKRLGREVRCDLCVEQGITSKRALREKDQRDIEEYEQKMAMRGLLNPENVDTSPNPEGITRLALKNMCRKNMDESTLMKALPGITHIVWRIERTSGHFLGQGWIEMATPDDAARAVARDGKIKLFGRQLYISYQKPDGKDAWPPPSSAVDASFLKA